MIVYIFPEKAPYIPMDGSESRSSFFVSFSFRSSFFLGSIYIRTLYPYTHDCAAVFSFFFLCVLCTEENVGQGGNPTVVL